MKRNYEIIRLLLLSLEGRDVDFSPYSNDELLFHKAYLCDANFAEGKPHYPSTTHSNIPDKVFLKKLTPKGHDFIDVIQDANKWDRIKSSIKNAGKTISIELIKLAASKLI